MPSQRKSDEETSLINNRKKNKNTGIPAPSVFARHSKDNEVERIRVRQQKRTKQTTAAKSRQAGQRRSYTPKPLLGHHSPSPRASPRRFSHGGSSDLFSFQPPPVETNPSPPARRAAGMHCPGASSARNIKEYLSNSLLYARTGGCCTPTTDSQTSSPVGSLGGQGAESFVKHVTMFRDSMKRYSELEPLTVDSFTQASTFRMHLKLRCGIYRSWKITRNRLRCTE